LAQVFAQKGEAWGVAVDQAVLDRLGVHVGDRVKLGTQDFEIRAVIAKEPDKIGTGGFTLGPRFLIARAALPATGLEQPGSMIYYDYRILLKPGESVPAAKAELNKRFGAAGWHIRDSRDAAPEIRSFITRLATFLTLVGLTALLVGGVGVGNAVKAYLDAPSPGPIWSRSWRCRRSASRWACWSARSRPGRCATSLPRACRSRSISASIRSGWRSPPPMAC
jgi:putative ABC transport system permease protein